jgi:hypothetical protein
MRRTVREKRGNLPAICNGFLTWEFNISLVESTGGRPAAPAGGAGGKGGELCVCGAERSETESSSDKKEGKQKMMRFLFIFLG